MSQIVKQMTIKHKQCECNPIDIDNNNGTHLKSSEPPCKKQKMCSQLYQKLIGGDYNHRTADILFIFGTNGEEMIPLHKSILASDSPVFYRMFFEQKVDKQMHDINTTAERFCTFLSFFYRSSMRLKRDDVPDLMQLAYKFDANRCKQMCYNFLKTTLETGCDDVLWVLQLSIDHKCKEIYERCVDMVHSFSYHLIETEQFQSCSRDVLTIILNDEFDGRNEWKLFDACVKWAQHATIKHKKTMSWEDIRRQLGDCFQLIRFNRMTSSEFVQCLSKYANIFGNKEINEISTAIIATERQNQLSLVKKLPLKPVHRGRLMTLNHVFEDRLTFYKLFNDTKTCDIDFEFDGSDDRISAHQSILAIKSSHFEKFFNKTKRISLKAISFGAFEGFLKLIYGFPLNVIELKDLDDILQLAYDYGVKDILKGHEKQFKQILGMDNLFWAYNLSNRFQFVDWFDFGLAWIQRFCYKMDLNKAFHANSLVHCSRFVVKNVLEIDYQHRNEVLVFEAVINWAKNRCTSNRSNTNLRNVMKRVLNLIRFQNMTTDEFKTCCSNYPDFFHKDEINCIFRMIQEKRNNNNKAVN